MQRSAKQAMVSEGLTPTARGTMAPSTTKRPFINSSVSPNGEKRGCSSDVMLVIGTNEDKDHAIIR